MAASERLPQVTVKPMAQQQLMQLEDLCLSLGPAAGCCRGSQFWGESSSMDAMPGPQRRQC